MIAVVLFFTVDWQAPWRRATYVLMEPEPVGNSIVYLPGSRDAHAKGPTIHAPRRQAPEPPPPQPDTPPPPAPVPALVDTATPAPLVYDPDASRVAPSPQVGDGRLWVNPRPGLPAAVADVIYGDTAARRSAAIDRLRAMVDTLNQVMDQEQREHRRPSWTVGGTSDKPAWGIDSMYIHVAGIKIPTTVLAGLGYLLKGRAADRFFGGGNFDEELRARQLADMRADILQAAARAHSLAQFRRYVRELRERKQAERDAEDRRRAQDTVKAVP